MLGLIALLPKWIPDDLAVTAVERGASRVGGFYGIAIGGGVEDVNEEEERGEMEIAERSHGNELEIVLGVWHVS